MSGVFLGESTGSTSEEEEMDAGSSNPPMPALNNWQQEDLKWGLFFTMEQRKEEDARSYAQRVIKRATALSEAPAEPSDFLETLIFFRVRNGLKTKIKDVLSTEHFQPTNLEDLLRGVDSIEKEQQGSAEVSHPGSGPPHSTPRRGTGGDYLQDAYPTSQSPSSASQASSTKRQKLIPTQSIERPKSQLNRGTVNKDPQISSRTLNRPSLPRKTAPATSSPSSVHTDERTRGIKRSQGYDYDYDEDDLQEYLHARGLQGRGGVPQDRAQNQNFAPLTNEEKNYRLNNGLCFRCGKAGHMKMECPLRTRDRK
ncbi:MAG: hypothetical protein Q9174_004716 [Haloplaca sp. 1 TL-2023]